MADQCLLEKTEPVLMELRVRTAGSLCGRIRVPGDKSITHRAFILGSLAKGNSRITGALSGRDCLATTECLRSLGATIERQSETDFLVQGRGLGGLREPQDVLDCRRSGTTMRLLMGVLAGQPFTTFLSGDEQLRRRPMARIAKPLRQMGAIVLGREDGQYAPLSIRGGMLRSITWDLPVASAQVKSAILLAGLYAEGRTVVREPGSARDHTERMLSASGAPISVEGNVISLEGPIPSLDTLDLIIPGDFSSAAYFLAAGCLVPNSRVTAEGVGINPTRTGFLDILASMGANLQVGNRREVNGEPVADVVAQTSELGGVQAGGDLIPRAIDEFPLVALAATQARGQTTIRDAAELRVKETDRIATTVEELRKLGARISAKPDGFVVEGPSRLVGTDVDSHGDHRLAMMLAMGGLAAIGDTRIRNADCIGDSFPGFERILAHIRG